MANPPVPLSFDPLAVLDGRSKELDSTRFSFKLDTGIYGRDLIIPDQMDLDENKMSIWIPFADGSNRDGVGDITEVTGLVVDRHRLNPISLFDHGKKVELPVGLSIDRDTGAYTVEIDAVNHTARGNVFFYQGKGLKGVERDREFDHAVYCEQLYHLLAQRLIRGGSFGYIILRSDPLPPDYATGSPQGVHLLKTLLLEFGPTVLPANQATVRKMLDMPTVCGKKISPYLVKSLTPFAPPQTKTVSGYEKKSAKDDVLQQVQEAVDTCTEEEWDGLYVWFNTDTPHIVIIDTMDWGDPEVGERIGNAAVKAVGDKSNVIFHNEGGKPEGKSWVEIKPKGREKSLPVPLDKLPDEPIPPSRWKPGEGAIKTIKLSDVKEAEKKWQRAVSSSVNPSVDMAVDRAEQNYRDLKRQWEEQKNRGQKSQSSDKISPEKAKEVLRDGTAQGHPLTDKQRAMFGAAAGKGEKSQIPGDLEWVKEEQQEEEHKDLPHETKASDVYWQHMVHTTANYDPKYLWKQALAEFRAPSNHPPLSFWWKQRDAAIALLRKHGADVRESAGVVYIGSVMVDGSSVDRSEKALQPHSDHAVTIPDSQSKLKPGDTLIARTYLSYFKPDGQAANFCHTGDRLKVVSIGDSAGFVEVRNKEGTVSKQPSSDLRKCLKSLRNRYGKKGFIAVPDRGQWWVSNSNHPGSASGPYRDRAEAESQARDLNSKERQSPHPGQEGMAQVGSREARAKVVRAERDGFVVELLEDGGGSSYRTGDKVKVGKQGFRTKSLPVEQKANQTSVTSRVWDRLRQGGFLSVNDLRDKMQLDVGMIQTAVDELVRQGKVETVSDKPGKPKLYSYKSLPSVSSKSLDLRKKYRKAANYRRKARRSAPGTSLVHVRAKDLDKVQTDAEGRGLKFERAGSSGQGTERVRLTGDDSHIDAVATGFGVKRGKSMGMKSYSMAERDKARKVQDRLLTLSIVQKFVKDNGENKPLWEGGPSASQLRSMIYPQWIYKVEELIRDNKSLNGRKALEPAGTIRDWLIRQSIVSNSDIDWYFQNHKVTVNGKETTDIRQILHFGDVLNIDGNPVEVKSMAHKEVKRHTKAAPEDMGTAPPPPEETETPGNEEPEGEPGSEKYSAQVLRRLHENALILLEEYDEMRGPLEHKEIDKHLQSKLEALVEEIEEIESLMQKHHPDAEPLAGEGEGEAEDKGLEDDETEDASEPEESTSEEEGMQTKALDMAKVGKDRGKYGKKGNLGIEGRHTPGNEENVGTVGKGLCPKCGSKNCTCGKSLNGKKDLGIEGSHEPGNEENVDTIHVKGLLPHHRKHLEETQGHLGDLSQANDLTDEHRMKSYHLHKSLDDIADHLLQKSFPAADKLDEEVNLTEPGEMGQKGAFPEAESSDEKVNLTHEGTKDMGADLGVEGQHEPGNEENESTIHPHVKAIQDASGFLKETAGAHDWTEEHRAKALMCSKALDPVMQEDEETEIEEGGPPEEGPGAMGEKALRETFLKQQKALMELNGKFSTLMTRMV